MISIFAEPTEQVAGNMDIQTALAIRHDFKNTGHAVKATEHPKGYWTINAYLKAVEPQPTRVINAQPEWRLPA